MKFGVILFALAFAAANASPVLFRAQMCDVAPAATPVTAPAPLSSPGEATANACQQQCEANGSCQSFVFGLTPSATAPKCVLFAVPADQVPSQGTNLNVFDKGCAASTVPTQAPTTTNPHSQKDGNVSKNGAGNGGTTDPSKQGNPGKRANICGAAPPGPSGNVPSPFQTVFNVASQQACLALCQQATGCQS